MGTETAILDCVNLGATFLPHVRDLIKFNCKKVKDNRSKPFHPAVNQIFSQALIPKVGTALSGDRLSVRSGLPLAVIPTRA